MWFERGEQIGLKIKNAFKGKGKVSMKIWKRNAVVSVIVLFVCVALYLSWSYGKTPGEDIDVFDPAASMKPSSSVSPMPSGSVKGSPSPSANAASNQYFDEARLSRKEARDAALEIYREAAGNETASQEIRDNATKEISVLAQNTVAEANIETLIKAKGYTECVVYINQDMAKVVVSEPEDGMTAKDANIIADIILGECEIEAGRINIVHVPV